MTLSKAKKKIHFCAYAREIALSNNAHGLIMENSSCSFVELKLLKSAIKTTLRDSY